MNSAILWQYWDKNAFKYIFFKSIHQVNLHKQRIGHWYLFLCKMTPNRIYINNSNIFYSFAFILAVKYKGIESLSQT